ncbi:ROK family protein, partial [Klebsiella quasipneumoniae]|nr:ROK family protein [Klebsiella quasipneumoniae]
TVASLSALKKQARMWLKTQPEATLSPEQLTTASLIEAWKEGDVQIRAWVDNAANAIGLSLYNFLNILNITQIWIYGRNCPFGENSIQSIV